MSKRRLKNADDDHDDPPLSRLFIVCSKSNTQDDFKKGFEKFGIIEDIRILKDREGESKGVAYVKFEKTSQAALACETMNGQQIGDSQRPVKVIVAASRQMGSQSRRSRDEEKAQRLFIITPKGITEDSLYDEFSKYGEIEDINMIRDRKTKDGKGFAYITYKKFSSTATAYENCDEKYKAVFAEPKPSRDTQASSSASSNYDRYGGSDDRLPSLLNTPFPAPGNNSSNNNNNNSDPSSLNDCVLHVMCSPMVTHDQLWRLFDIVPNMDYCKMNQESDVSSSATVVYKTHQAALHARQKLHGFEYPIGERLIVKLSSELTNFQPEPMSMSFYGNSNDTNFCSVPLPPTQPMAQTSASCAQRLFIVCSPHVLPLHVLKKVFCRFGFLIDVYLLNNRNCGYVKYAKIESARQAMKTLHGAEIYGVRLKVLEAEEQSDSRKRTKMDME